MIAADPARTSSVVVGTGRLGRALAAALTAVGTATEHFGGRAAARDAGPVVAALRRAGPEALLLLAVRDDAIAAVASSIAAAARDLPPGATALHVSGSLGLEVLAPLSALGLPVGSCHPLQTFTGSQEDAARFRGAVFAVDGTAAGQAAAERLALGLGGRPVAVPASRRGLYHLAASLGANGLTSVVAAARDALAAAGFAPEEALSALSPLLRASLDEALRAGPEASLTGPAARGDEATLERHRRTILAWDSRRAALLEALLREQRRLAGRSGAGAGC